MNAYAQDPAGPDAALAALDRLVGVWRVTGGAEGTVVYRWLEGRHFLLQDVDLVQDGTRVVGLEVIGRERVFGAERPGEDIRSRFYDSLGNTFDYVYELAGDTLAIWAGEKGSSTRYTGAFSADGSTVTGPWTYPGGGGYDSTMVRTG
ncbi:hypothetical protein [Nocardiopsis tropica]|uniref:DUF1579 domain-containing protein n=1 Tax=Nocardiopsis tropica TaxID=109330 RepID=A0ABU7KN21_9ACTN|nr:hypothetical protein [Nocardiopsis umidischolae]MEE2050695.1 hypothetical protein [Nocardiopsis umidischolae]